MPVLAFSLGKEDFNWSIIGWFMGHKLNPLPFSTRTLEQPGFVPASQSAIHRFMKHFREVPKAKPLAASFTFECFFFKFCLPCAFDARSSFLLICTFNSASKCGAFGSCRICGFIGLILFDLPIKSFYRYLRLPFSCLGIVACM